ncbi:MAG: hypothetical protein G01um101420_694 [Parcubacteria group bacterium Gr01-1014_20]|nr:MAG: hypothetical protein G01um101420_694 [Parcubacteria group bacterium Gr01-1014_20]
MSPLVGIHIALGEFGALAFLWALVELLNPTEARISRAKKAALLGVVMFFAAWLVGGFYYVDYYGTNVKPIIKGGPTPWAHGVMMETKEHLFLFLPFLAILAWSLIKKYGNMIISDQGLKVSIILLCGLIVLLAFSMAGMGYLISSGFRGAIETNLTPPL